MAHILTIITTNAKIKVGSCFLLLLCFLPELLSGLFWEGAVVAAAAGVDHAHGDAALVGRPLSVRLGDGQQGDVGDGVVARVPDTGTCHICNSTVGDAAPTRLLRGRPLKAKRHPDQLVQPDVGVDRRGLTTYSRLESTLPRPSQELLDVW